MQAVVFVRDLDRSVLGWGGHGLEHYLKLRAATDIVVNSILRVRRLLKQKRVANAGGGFTVQASTLYTKHEAACSLALQRPHNLRCYYACLYIIGLINALDKSSKSELPQPQSYVR